MQVVRKELASTDIQPAGVRFNVGSDVFQTSPDGGTTWNDNPVGDPRFNAGYQLPHRTSGDPQCDAAANMTAKIKSAVDYWVATGNQLSFVSYFLTFVSLFFFPVAWIIELIWALADLLLTLGTTVVAGAFTTEVYDDIKCFLYAQLDANGQMTPDGYNAFLVALDAAHSGTVYNVTKAITDTMGSTGLNNAGATGEETGDCTGCTPAIVLEVCDGYGTFLTDLGGGVWSVHTAEVVSGYNQVWIHCSTTFHLDALSFPGHSRLYSDYSTSQECGWTGGSARDPVGHDMLSFYCEFDDGLFDLTITVSPP